MNINTNSIKRSSNAGLEFLEDIFCVHSHEPEESNKERLFTKKYANMAKAKKKRKIANRSRRQNRGLR